MVGSVCSKSTIPNEEVFLYYLAQFVNSCASLIDILYKLTFLLGFQGAKVE